MGAVSQSSSSSMQAFLCISALVAATSAAPQIFRGGLAGVGVTSTRVGGAPTVGAPTPPHPITKGVRGVGHGLVGGVGHAVATHAVATPLVASVAHPLAHGVGISHGLVGHGVGHGVVGHAVAHPIAHAVAEIYPYTYQYAVADDYSGSRFDASETDDGTAARQGHYSVNLPDGRIQHVNYHANDIDGYVAEVTYDGQAVFPDVVAAPVAHAIARPVAIARPIVAHAVARPVAIARPVVAHAVARPVGAI